MGRTVALSVLRSDVRFKADVGGATVRHTDAQLNRLINQSIQMFRERISDEGSTHYLVASSGTLTEGTTSPYPFFVLDLSTLSPALVRTYGIDVTFDGGRVETLSHVPFEERAKYGTTQEGGRPFAWAHFRTDQVAILPAPNGSYPYTVWYLPKFTDLSADGDTFDGVAGWEEWVVWDVVCQVIARDQFPQAFAIAEQRRAEIEQRVIRGATKVSQAGGAHVGRDSFGRKLTHFLGGRTQAQTTSGGPYVPGAGSVTNQMLADMTGPTVKAVMSGTTRPQDVQVATLTTYLGLFNTTQRGTVPPPLGLGGLFLKDDGTWAAPAGGGGGGGSVGPSGAVQFQAGTGMAGASGLRIIGNSPSLLLRLDGAMRVTGGAVEVGSGTTKVTATGLDVGGGGVVNVATLVATDARFNALKVTAGLANTELASMASGTVKAQMGPAGTPSDVSVNTLLGFVPTFTATQRGTVPGSGGGTSNFLRADGSWAAPPGGGGAATGVTNDQLEVAPTGTVKGRLSGTGAVQDVSIATLHAFAPTFTATQPGTVPESGGGTANFLRADGSWSAPPPGGTVGGGNRSVQYNNAGSLAGFTGISIIGSSEITAGLAFGNPTLLSGFVGGQISVASAFSIRALTASGGSQFLFQWTPPTTGATGGTLGLGQNNTTFGGALRSITGDVATGGVYQWRFGGGSGAKLTETGLDVTNFHVAARSISLATGIDPSQLQAMGSGTVLGNLSGTGTPSPVAIATLHAFAPTFTATQPGTVPESGGGTTNFLRADGTWSTPPAGAGGNAAGGEGFVQYRDAAGGFQGASGVSIVASGQALLIGHASGAPTVGDIRLGDRLQGSIVGLGRGNQNQTLWNYAASGAGGSTGGVLTYGRGSGSVQLHRLQTAPSGSIEFELGASGVQSLRFMPTGVDFKSHPLAVKSIRVVDTIPNSELATMATGTFKGSLGGGTPADVSVNTLLAFAPTFTATTQGVVPPSGGGTTNFLSAAGTWIAPSGAHQFPPVAGATNAQLAVMATGTVKANLSGNNVPSDVPVNTLLAFAPTFTSTKAGTVPPSGGGTDNFLRADGTWIAPSGAHQFPPVAGATNAQLALMSTGTVKANLTGNAAPSDVPVNTLLAFAPTFTSTKAGTVPPSGGGTTNFLRADGTWTTPTSGPATPGGGPNSIQFNSAGTTDGASGFGFSSAGGALGIGVPSFLPGAGDLRVASGFNITANLPSGIAGVAARQNLLDWSGGGASGVLKVGGASGVMGTHRSEVATGGSFEWLIGGQTGMALRPTGLDAPGLHINAKSLSVGHINGLPFDFNGIKRGLDIGNASGLLSASGLNLYLPRGAGSGANRYIIPSGIVGTGTQFVTLNPTGGRGGGVVRIEKLSAGGYNFEVRTPTGDVLHNFPSGTKGWADFLFEKPSATAKVFQLGGHADMF